MASMVTLGHIVKANEDAAIFDTLGNMNDWIELHILNAVTNISIPQLRSAPRRQYIALRDEVYGEDPVSAKLRVSRRELPWILIPCTCVCGCLLICVDHIDDEHTDVECSKVLPLLSMRRILTDDILQASNDQGINIIKLYSRISDLSDTELEALPHYYYWPLQTAMSRAINDPLWPDEMDSNALVNQWHGQSLDVL